MQMIIQVKVKPNAGQSSFEPLDDGTFRARLKSQPIEGRANDELLRLVARHFERPKSAVSIRMGSTGRIKLVQIQPF